MHAIHEFQGDKTALIFVKDFVNLRVKRLALLTCLSLRSSLLFSAPGICWQSSFSNGYITVGVRADSILQALSFTLVMLNSFTCLSTIVPPALKDCVSPAY